MGKIGKKFITLLAAVVIGCAAAGCAKDGQSFAKTPEEEYDRICSIDGDGVIFDFSTLSKLQISQTVFMDSVLVREANDGNATHESTLFQLDRSDAKSAVSYGETNYINSMYLPNLDEKIAFNTEKYGYKNSFDYFGRQYTDGYEEYVGDYRTQNAPDVKYKSCIKLLARDKFEEMSGGKSGGVYTITATVKQSEFSAFYEWFESFYPFIHHSDGEGNFKYYLTDKTDSVTFQIKSTRTQLSEVSFSAVVAANPDVFGADASDGDGNVTEKVTVNAKTVFSRSGFEVAPENPPDWWK